MKSNSQLIPSWILLLLILIQLAFISWSANRGFDFTDEAFSFLGLRNPEEGNKIATYYTTIFNSLFSWIGITIIKIRIIRLSLLLGCAVVLALGLNNWLKRNSEVNKATQVNLFLFIVLGSLLTHANGSQALTYNTFSNFILQLIVGLLLITFQRKSQISKQDQLINFLLGALVLALFAIKSSAGVIMFLLIALVTIYDRRVTKITIRYFIFFIVGLLSMGIFVFGLNLFNWLADYIYTLKFLSSLTTASIGSRYIEDFYFTFSSKIQANLLYIITIAMLLLMSQLDLKKWKKGMITAVISGVLIYIAYQRDFYLGGVKYYYIFTGLYILFIFTLFFTELISALISFVKKIKQNNLLLVTASILFIIPITGAIGTNNLLSIQIIWYTSFLFAGIFLMVYKYEPLLRNSIIIVLSINATFQSISGLVYHPYRINQTLYEESHLLPSEITGEKILVNKEIKQSVETTFKLITSKTNFQKGDPMFSFSSDYFGFIYFLDGILPGWGWYGEVGTPYNCYNLMNSQMKNLDRMIILSPSYYEIDSIYNNCFKEMNINFPAQYSKIGEVPYFMGDTDRSFTIFVPQSFLKE